MATSTTKRQIRAVPGDVPQSLRGILGDMRDALIGLTKNDSTSRAPTIAELTAAGLISTVDGGKTIRNSVGLNYSRPSAVTGLTATGAFATIIVQWDAQPSTVGYVEIFRSTTNDQTTAVKVGQSASSIFTDTPPNSSTAVTYYYWVRAVSTGGTTGPFNAIAGTPATTANDPTYALDILAGQIGSSELNTALNDQIAWSTDYIAQMGSTDWVSGHAYSVGDYVAYQGSIYKCSTANSDTTFTPGHWTLAVNLYTATDQNASDITALQTTVNDPTSGVVANAANISTNTTDIATNQGNIATNASDISALQTTVNDPSTGVAANAAAIGTLNTEVSTNQGNISANASAISALQTTVNDPSTGVVANAGAISTLQTNVSTNQGNISANASSISMLNTEVGNNSAAIAVEQTVRAQAIAPDWVAATTYAVGDTVNYSGQVYRCTTANSDSTWTAGHWALASNVYGQYTVKIDVNNKVVGFGLANDGPGNASDNFEVVADKFAIMPAYSAWVASTAYAVGDMACPTIGGAYVYLCTVAGTSGTTEPTWPTTVGNTVVDGGVTWKCVALASVVPFVVDAATGTTYMDNALIKDASILGAKIANAAIDTAQIANLAVTTGKIAALAVGDAEINDVSAGKITAGTIAVALELTSPVVRYGQTAFNTGIGFWIGNASGTAKLSVGDPSGANLNWDGSNLNLTGSFIPVYTAGTIAYVSNPTAINDSYNPGTTSAAQWWSAWKTARKWQLPGSGTVTVSYSGHTQMLNTGGYIALQLQVYVNGVATGPLHSVSVQAAGVVTSASFSFSDNVSLTSGQTVSLHYRLGAESSSGPNSTTINGVTISTNEYLAPAEII